jgi:hypothetical protein
VESRYWREQDARAVLDEFGASGLGVQAFCRRYGVSEQRVRYWQRRLAASADVTAAPVFLPVRIVTPRIAVADEPIEIVVRGERTVRVRAGFDQGLLRRVLEVLEC